MLEILSYLLIYNVCAFLSAHESNIHITLVLKGMQHQKLQIEVWNQTQVEFYWILNIKKLLNDLASKILEGHLAG